MAWKACKSSDKYVRFQTRQRQTTAERERVFPQASIVTVLGEGEELL